MRKLVATLLISTLSFPLIGQMTQADQTVLYGNEWIDYDRTYFKIKVAEDGIYRLSFSTMQAAGIPTQQLAGRQYKIYHLGEEIPIFTSNDQIWSENDYLEFYGEKNRSELDQYLFNAPEEEMLNPEYSLISDTSVYFLTWSDTPDGLRYEAVPNELDNIPQAENWYWKKTEAIYSDVFFDHRYFQDAISYSHFDEGEGFAGKSSDLHNISLSPEAPFVNGPDAKLKLRLVSDRSNHHLKISINNQVQYQKDTFPSYSIYQQEFPVPAGALNNAIDLTVEGLLENNDKYRIANIRLDYPSHFSFDDLSYATIQLRPVAQNLYFELEQFDLSGNTISLYAPESGRKTTAVIQQGIAKFVWENIPGETLILNNENIASKEIEVLTPVNFIDYRDDDASFLIISHPALIDDESQIVQDYAAYRQSQTGGSFTVNIADVFQLSDQFGYGIDGHPQAFRNFAHFMRASASPLQFVLLIGKGLEYQYVRAANAPEILARHLVPTFGSPGSDHLLFSNNNSPVPIFPVGRVAAETPQELKTYLNKVQKYERTFSLPLTFENHAWRKKILHLKGGNPNEQNFFGGLLDVMGEEAMNNGVGASVTSVEKVSTAPVSQSISENVIRAINDGILIKSFLGHGAVVNTDFGLDDPEIFEENDRYPLAFSLGCLTGNVFTTQNSVSERFIFAQDKGAIGYIASSGYGTPVPLASLGTEFYRLMGDELYGKSIGEILVAMRENLDGPNAVTRVTMLEQINYHGDPAIRLHHLPGPDYVINFSSVKIGPAPINIQTDSITISFQLANIGKVNREHVIFQLEHITPDGASYFYRDSILLSSSITDVRSTIPLTEESRAPGINALKIYIDPDNQIAEGPNPQAEQNNILIGPNGEQSVNFFINENALHPIYPRNFSIVNDQDLAFLVSTSNIFTEDQHYLLEIDTTATFDSPLKVSDQSFSSGGRIDWAPNFNYLDNTVYYWRIRPETAAPDQPAVPWTQQSFLFSSQLSPGWNQSHYFQFLENDFQNIEIDSSSRQWAFIPSQNSVIAESVVQGVASSDRSRLLYNSQRIFIAPSTYGRNLSVISFNPVTGTARTAPNGRVGRTFPMHTPEGRKAIMDYLEEDIPEGDYVVIMTYHQEDQSYHPEEWAADSVTFGVNLFQALESQGAQLVRQLASLGSKPYVLAYQKGQGLINENIGLGDESRLSILVNIPGRWDEGTVFSKIIGPAKKWENVSWDLRALEETGSDSTGISLWGLTDENTSPEKILDLNDPNTPINSISTEQYPYLQLVLTGRDSAFRTPPQLNFWRITHESADDLGLQLIGFSKDTVAQGEPISVQLGIYNLSPSAIDSIGLRFAITNEANALQTFTVYPRNIPAQDTIIYNWTIDTEALRGDHQLTIDLNPAQQPIESDRANNFGFKNFHVLFDKANPLLDVTFDGIRILDGDLVSPTPLIVVELEDENEFLPLADTSYLSLSLVSPDGSTERLYFQQPEIQFFPPSGNKNSARIEYSPNFIEDGEYQLIANGRDASGNPAGTLDYRVNFKVLNQNSISHLLPYPNPFTTQTRFQYTFTGGELPEGFLIRIMTVSGRVVKEITHHDFGNLKVGTHLSDYVWDGTDNFGDRLANGVYLYQLILQGQNAHQFDHFSQSTDRFFQRDIGKIVILR